MRNTGERVLLGRLEVKNSDTIRIIAATMAAVPIVVLVRALSQPKVVSVFLTKMVWKRVSM